MSTKFVFKFKNKKGETIAAPEVEIEDSFLYHFLKDAEYFGCSLEEAIAKRVQLSAFKRYPTRIPDWLIDILLPSALCVLVTMIYCSIGHRILL